MWSGAATSRLKSARKSRYWPCVSSGLNSALRTIRLLMNRADFP